MSLKVSSHRRRELNNLVVERVNSLDDCLHPLLGPSHVIHRSGWPNNTCVVWSASNDTLPWPARREQRQVGSLRSRVIRTTVVNCHMGPPPLNAGSSFYHRKDGIRPRDCPSDVRPEISRRTSIGFFSPFCVVLGKSINWREGDFSVDFYCVDCRHTLARRSKRDLA